VSAVSAAFEQAAAESRAALVGYVPAGFPSVAGAISAAQATVKGLNEITERVLGIAPKSVSPVSATPASKQQDRTSAAQAASRRPSRSL